MAEMGTPPPVELQTPKPELPAYLRGAQSIIHLARAIRGTSIKPDRPPGNPRGGQPGLVRANRIARSMAAIYCATQKYTVNSGLGIYDLTGSHRHKGA
jgi:hypothetical protein